jgi:hypothetical protein
MRRPARRSSMTAPGMAAEARVHTRALGLLVRAALVVAVLAATAAAAPGAAADQWWKVDTHEHSAFSGDGRADLGIDAADDKAVGYNAAFITDHDRMNSFSIQGANGNYIDYHDVLSGRWLASTLGAASGSANTVVSRPVHAGTKSLHLAVTSSSARSGRTFVYAKRGSNLFSGAITLDFWVYPVRISSGSGVDVSVSLGGDSTTGVRTFGYTTADGTPHPGKSTVLVWQLGAARAAASDATTHVITSSLPYALRTWNHYLINVSSGAVSWTPSGGATTSVSSSGLSSLSAADRPVNYAVLAEPIMEASAANGSADAYFDDYVLKVAKPHCPAADFVYRNRLIDSGRFNGRNASGQRFVLFPAREMGQIHHTQQFNFDIKRPSQYYDAYSDSVANDARLCASSNTRSARWKFAYHGSDNIRSVQASGYPAQDDHPGITDTTRDVIKTRAHGAQLVEVQGAADYSSTWEAILRQGHQVIGSYSTDAHMGVGKGAPADYIYAPSLTLSSLTHSLFAGRLYMAPNNFGGRIVFNLDPRSQAPYHARYPAAVPFGQTSAAVHLAITGGLVPGETIRWVYNNGAGDQRFVDTVSGPAYNATKSIPLSGTFTFVRAEVRDNIGDLVANTEAIFFRPKANLSVGLTPRRASPRLRVRRARWHRGQVRISGRAARGLRHRVRVGFACGPRAGQHSGRLVRVRAGRFRVSLGVRQACHRARRGVVAAAYRGDARHRAQRVHRRVRRR